MPCSEEALNEVMKPAVTFLDEVGVSVADSVTLLAWKADLVATAKAALPLGGTIVPGVDRLLELQESSGLAAALKRETTSEPTFSAELWLEDVAEECFVPLLTPSCKGEVASRDGPRLDQYRR